MLTALTEQVRCPFENALFSTNTNRDTNDAQRPPEAQGIEHKRTGSDAGVDRTLQERNSVVKTMRSVQVLSESTRYTDVRVVLDHSH